MLNHTGSRITINVTRRIGGINIRNIGCNTHAIIRINIIHCIFRKLVPLHSIKPKNGHNCLQKFTAINAIQMLIQAIHNKSLSSRNRFINNNEQTVIQFILDLSFAHPLTIFRKSEKLSNVFVAINTSIFLRLFMTFHFIGQISTIHHDIY